MNLKELLVYLGKLLVGGLAFIVGMPIGGMVATFLGLQQPAMPEGVNVANGMIYILLESPLFALMLALLATGLAGKFLPRALTLAFFAWATYTLNTVIEGAAFLSTSVSNSVFTAITFLVPCLFCGAVIAFFFPPAEKGTDWIATAKSYFSSRKIGAWSWRLAVATLAFMPIYLLFGSLVAPITAEYFRNQMYGLRMPSQGEIYIVLGIRSLIFLTACLPILMVWKKSARQLFLRLGLGLFAFVGLLYMLVAEYMPLIIRIPHSLEILADSFVYAGILVVVLAKGAVTPESKT